jgi:RluA family pseudouridine synthase
VIKLSSPATREFWEIPVLFEDDSLLALDKPPLLLTSPSREEPHRPSLMKLLHQGIAGGATWASSRRLTYLTNAHRLDSESSGVLLLAKSKSVLIDLANLFSSAKVTLKLLALVEGTPTKEEILVEAKLAPHPTAPSVMRVDPRQGKRSQTRFRVRERFDGYTLLECQPLTHRPHQIRAHLQHLRLPMAGDATYGGRPLLLSQLKPAYRLKPQKTERPLMSYPALHAEEMSLTHPVTGLEMRATAPWPKDLTVAVKYLRRYALAPSQQPPMVTQ